MNNSFLLLVGSYLYDNARCDSDLDLVFITEDTNFKLFLFISNQIKRFLPSLKVYVKYVELINLDYYLNNLSNWLNFLNNKFICGDENLFKTFRQQMNTNFLNTSIAKLIFLYVNDLNRKFTFNNSNYKNGLYGHVDIEFLQLIRYYIQLNYNILDTNIDSLIKKSFNNLVPQNHFHGQNIKKFNNKKDYFYLISNNLIMNYFQQNRLFYLSRNELIKILKKYE